VNEVQDADIGGDTQTRVEGRLSHSQRVRLNDFGRSWAEIRAELVALKRGDYDWRSGRVPIYVYHDTDELLAVSREAYNLYFSENALGRRAFPSLARMEDQVIQLSLSLFRAPPEAVGSFTSGGTESLFLALKAARDYFRATQNEINPGSRLNIVIPFTAHPAFDKAAQYLDVEVIRTPIGADLRADVTALGAAVNERTMLIAGAAPCYPYGVFDPITLLAELASEKGVWLHVDACLGGFLAPFARDEGFPIPDFDLSIPGVASLSADLHKFGFSARGASVLLLNSAQLKAYQGFQFENWPRGSYSTETFPGSRPGGAVASAWAVTQYLGHAGYRRLACKIMETKARLVAGIERIPSLEVLRPSELNVVLYRSVDEALDIDAVADELGQEGWFVGRSREPRAIHLALNAVHAHCIDKYLIDLQRAVRRVRLTGRVGVRDDMTY
jgi:glutamate/tyrosine decarboxylase-like PLP-dependent enzyme